MTFLRTLAALALAAVILPLAAQGSSMAQQAPPASSSQQATPAKRTPPKPQTQQAAGAGSDKVWVNNKTNVYHCPGDRYYGKTMDGKYMTEPDAKKAGAHGAHNQTCFK